MASFRAHFKSALRRGVRKLPVSMRLRVLTWLDVRQGVIELENVHLPRLAPRERRAVALDVGANDGVTTMLMAREFDLVHAFEPNPQLAAELLIVAPKNVRVHSLALSSQAGRAELAIPIDRGVTLSGWGSLSGTRLHAFDRLDKVLVETRTLDSFAFDRVDYLKIDVEGHEMAVLEGARETIRRCRPWLVVEASGAQREPLRAFLTPFGYRETNLRSLTGVIGSEHNMVFLPPVNS